MHEQECASSFGFRSTGKQTRRLTQTTRRFKMEISSLEMWPSLPCSSKLSAFCLQKSTMSLPSNNIQAVAAHKPPKCSLSGANNYSISMIGMCHTHSAWVPYREEPKYLSASIWLHKVCMQNVLFHFSWKDGFITLSIRSWRFPIPLLSGLHTLFLHLRGIC